MSIYTRTETVEAMRWVGHCARCLQARSLDVVAWIKAHGGEARYIPEFYLTSHSDQDDHRPRIAVRTSTGWAYAAPGDAIVNTYVRFRSNRENYSGPWVIGFTVVPAAEWNKQGWKTNV